MPEFNKARKETGDTRHNPMVVGAGCIIILKGGEGIMLNINKIYLNYLLKFDLQNFKKLFLSQRNMRIFSLGFCCILNIAKKSVLCYIHTYINFQDYQCFPLMVKSVKNNIPCYWVGQKVPSVFK